MPANRDSWVFVLLVISASAVLVSLPVAETFLAMACVAWVAGRPKPIVGVPAWICLIGTGSLWLTAKATGRKSAFTYQTYTGLVQDAAPSHQSASDDLGYRPRTFQAGLATLASLRDCLGRPR